LKVVLLNTYGVSGGAAKAAYGLLDGLRRIGCDATMLSLVVSGHYPNVVAHDVSLSQVQRDQKFSALLRQHALALEHPDWFSPPCSVANLAANPLVASADVINLHWVAGFVSTEDIDAMLCLNKPVVWTLHDERPLSGGCHYTAGCLGFQSHCACCPQLKTDFHGLAHSSLAFDDAALADRENLALVAPSKWIANQARKSKRFRSNSVRVIPYDVDTEFFRPARDEAHRRLLRKKFGVPEDAFVILTGAAFLDERRKGLEILFEALKLLVKNARGAGLLKQRKVVLCLFGGGKVPGHQSLGLPFVALGSGVSESEVARFFQIADLFVCPSIEDNLPNTVIEAMACGVPILGTDVGGIPDLVEHTVNGRIVPRSNPESLASAIAKFLAADQQSHQRMSAMSVMKSKELHSRPHQAKAYEALFAEMLDAPRTWEPQVSRLEKYGSAHGETMSALFSSLQGAEKQVSERVSRHLGKYAWNLLRRNWTKGGG